MTLARLNLISAVISILGSLLFVVIQTLSAYLWLVASIVWLVLAVYYRGDSSLVKSPGRHLIRRFSRLLLFS